jgi:hypothetical protein
MDFRGEYSLLLPTQSLLPMGEINAKDAKAQRKDKPRGNCSLMNHHTLIDFYSLLPFAPWRSLRLCVEYPAMGVLGGWGHLLGFLTLVFTPYG